MSGNARPMAIICEIESPSSELHTASIYANTFLYPNLIGDYVILMTRFANLEIHSVFHSALSTTPSISQVSQRQESYSFEANLVACLISQNRNPDVMPPMTSRSAHETREPKLVKLSFRHTLPRTQLCRRPGDGGRADQPLQCRQSKQELWVVWPTSVPPKRFSNGAS